MREKGPAVVWTFIGEKYRDSRQKRLTLKGINLSNREFFGFFNANANNYRGQNIKELIGSLTGNKHFSFIIDHKKKGEYLKVLKRINPSAYEKTMAEADKICRHIFDLLGSGPVHLGEQINWHIDFKTGHRWPARYFKDITYKDYTSNADIKVPLELSRFQHLTTLGKAYWFSDDEKYAREFVVQLSDWIDKNPPGLGVNWSCTMDAALRAVNWLWGYHFFKDSNGLAGEFLVKFYKSLFLHGRHIMGNLEYAARGKTNHYIADLVGLLYVGLFFRDSEEAKNWYDFARQAILEELRDQVYDDGMNHEASTAYHRFVLELFYSAAVLCRSNHDDWPPEAWEKIHKMFRFLKGIVKPNARIPQIGDNDSGRVHKLQYLENELDITYLFPLAAVLFDDPSFKIKGSEFSEETLWLLGPGVFKKYENMKEGIALESLQSISFPDGGIYVLRDNKNYCVVSAGPNGQKGNGGHSHNDKLSFELNIDGIDLIVDPGTYIYTGNYKERNLFRSTKYHNTLVLDDHEINPFDEFKLFQLLEKNTCMVQDFNEDNERIVFCGSHQAFGTLYTRQIEYLKKEKAWLIKDLFPETDNQSHLFSLYFHFARGIDIRKSQWVERQDAASLLGHDSTLQNVTGWVIQAHRQETRAFRLLAAAAVPITGKIELAWVSPRYGVKEEAHLLEVKAVSTLPVRFLSVIHPI